MTKEEAFRQWINNTQGKGLTYQEMWDAACEWQKEEDIRIILDPLKSWHPYGELYEEDVRNLCAYEVENQL